MSTTLSFKTLSPDLPREYSGIHFSNPLLKIRTKRNCPECRKYCTRTRQFRSGLSILQHMYKEHDDLSKQEVNSIMQELLQTIWEEQQK